MTADEARAFAVIWPLLGRHIAFHRRLVDITESVKAALLLSQAIYWTRHGRVVDQRGGWVLKSAQQWSLETGLSAREQASARAALARLRIWQEQRAGVPARLRFRLSLPRLAGLLAECPLPPAVVAAIRPVVPGPAGLALPPVARLAPEAGWDDPLGLIALLGPSLAYHRVLAGLAGGVHAGLVLSRALHLTRQRWHQGGDLDIVASAAHWTRELGLSRRELESARRDLMTLGLWEETLAGVPARLRVRVRLASLLERLSCETLPATRPVAADRGDPTTWDAPMRKTGLRDFHSLVSTKAPIQSRRNRHHRFDESAKLEEGLSTGVSVQTPPRAHAHEKPAPVVAARPGGGDPALLFPPGLSEAEQTAARHLLAHCPQHAQALLDELAARLQAGSVRTGAIAYLRGLVARCEAGRFVPELGLQVAARRDAERRHRLARDQERSQSRLAAEQARDPAHRARVQAHLAEIRQLLRGASARADASAGSVADTAGNVDSAPIPADADPAGSQPRSIHGP
jgi:hypothetical protein